MYLNNRRNLLGDIAYNHLVDQPIASRDILVKKITMSENTIILIDINNFMYYNEIYGHATGDLILNKFKVFLKLYGITHGYEPYHIAGDQFALLCTHAKVCFDDLETSIERLMKKIKKFTVPAEVNIRISATIGIAFNEIDALTKAEIALKHAKENNNKYITYCQNIIEGSNHEDVLYWQKEISFALNNDLIIPYYQPIVDEGARVVKYEALIRIKKNHDNKEIEIISPYKFLEISKKTKQYNALSQQMYTQVFKDMKDVDLPFSLNISILDIEHKSTIKLLKKLLSHYRAYQNKKFGNANRVCFEILEDENVGTSDNYNYFIEAFEQFDTVIAIDDFGSGYSNFSNLLHINPKYLKIDGSLIKDVTINKNLEVLVRAIIQFAHELNIQVVAEFVHSKEVFDMLKHFGVDLFQGYYFGQPNILAHQVNHY